MKVIMETFESPVPSTTQPSDVSGREQQYMLMLDELKKYLEEGNVEKVRETNDKIRTVLTKYIKEIEDTRNDLEEEEKMYNADDIIDNTKELQLMGHANNILSKRLTFRRKYENVKSSDLLDKKRITVLYIINAFLLLVLVYGCFLVFKEQTYSLDFIKSKLSSSKKSNNKNNNRNNNRNNNSNNNSNNSSS
tara:strand:- start:397 stop:972 length:576 start_codon:yes stop_codon:yes gene_type:complete